jgi:hypothetical protein
MSAGIAAQPANLPHRLQHDLKKVASAKKLFLKLESLHTFGNSQEHQIVPDSVVLPPTPLSSPMCPGTVQTS